MLMLMSLLKTRLITCLSINENPKLMVQVLLPKIVLRFQIDKSVVIPMLIFMLMPFL